MEHSPHCIPHHLLWPSRELPTPAAPVHVSGTPSPSKQSEVAAPSPSGSTYVPSLVLFSFCCLSSCSDSQCPCPTMIKTPQSSGVNSKFSPSGSSLLLLTLVFSGFADYMAAYTACEARKKAKPTSGANTSSPREPRKTVFISLLLLCPLFCVRTTLLSGFYPEEGTRSPFSSEEICPVS